MTTNEVLLSTGFEKSADGSAIAWTRQGSGPPLLMVHCVAVSQTATPQPTLPASLAEHFTVYTYDRRGTGLSTANAPYRVEREFEDMAAILALSSSPAYVYGFSSGANLTLQAAQSGVPMQALLLLEPPLFDDPDLDFRMRDEAQRRIDMDLAGARHWFDTEIVGVPVEILAELPIPSAADLENTRTIVHELTFLPGTPASRFADVTTETLLIASDHTAPDIHTWATQLEQEMPHATRLVLPGEWHGVDDETLTEAIRMWVSTTTASDSEL